MQMDNTRTLKLDLLVFVMLFIVSVNVAAGVDDSHSQGLDYQWILRLIHQMPRAGIIVEKQNLQVMIVLVFRFISSF